MLVCRPVLSLAAQGITALILQRKVSRQSWRAAAQYWMAYTSLVDLGCIAILAQQARRESTPLRTAMGFEERPPRPLRSALADVALVVPATFASQLLSRPLSDGDPYPPQIRVAHLHGWTKAYSITIWPVVWGISEQATYLGYALPRLEDRIGRLPAATLTAIAWALQHTVIPALPGRRYAVMRAMTMLPVSAAFIAVYTTRGRRLAPLAAAHWLSDTSAALLAGSLRSPDSTDPRPRRM